MGRQLATITIVFLLLMSLLAMAPPAITVGADTGSRSTVYTTDFESGEGNWTHGGPADDWELGEPTAGPTGAHSGDNCWGTDLDSDYDSNSNAYLMSPSISLSGATSAYLEFFHWYKIFAFIFMDRGYVEISTDGGVDFETLMNITGSSEDNDWEKETIDLDGYVGKTIKVRFRLYSDGMIEDRGWYIDDFKVKVDEQPAQEAHDLAVTAIDVKPPNPRINEDIYFTVLVENKGDFEESGYKVTIKIGDPDKGQVIYTDTKDGTSLEPGEIAKFAFVWKPTSPGMYVVEASVSLDGDSEPDNDEMMLRLRVGASPHDIAIIELYVMPKTPTVGKVATIIVVVENRGEVEEVGVPVTVKVHDPAKVLVLDKTQTIDLLEVGGKVSLSFPWTPKSPGEYHVKASAKLSPDAFPDNNQRDLYVTVPSTGPDMTIEDLKVEPGDSGPGLERTITSKVSNVGSQEARDVKLSYEISNATSLVASGSEDLGTMGPGKSKKSEWKFTPDKDGTYTLKVTVSSVDDINPKNDEKVLLFVVPFVAHDVGIESISVLPRTGGLDVKRTIRAEVGNFGDERESFKATVTVTDPGGAVVLTKEWDVDLEPDPAVKVNLDTEYTPVTYGNHTVTARTLLAGDTEPANDEASTIFIVNYHDFHDVGIDTMAVDPISGNLSQRDLSVKVRNYGTVNETYNVVIEVYNESGGLEVTFSQDGSLVPGGEKEHVTTPQMIEVGNYTARAEVKVPLDDLLENNVMSMDFWVTATDPVNDVAITQLSVIPRTGGIEQRSIQVHVRNMGSSDQSDIPLLVKVTWPGHQETVFDDITPTDLVPGQNETVAIDWTPPDHGTYTVTATVNATNDDFPANDEMTTELYSTAQLHMDLGVENLRVEPRTDYTGVLRTITASVFNYGEEVKALVQIIVRDPSGAIVGRKNHTEVLGPEKWLDVQYDLTPIVVQEYEVEAIVSMVDGEVDTEPANDRLSMTFFAREPPPPIDIGVESIVVPMPWETGRDIDIITSLTNHGTQKASGVAHLELVDPDGHMTKWDEAFDLGPGRSTEVMVTIVPVLAGRYNVTATTAVPDDGNPDNDIGRTSFDVAAVGGKDAAVTQLDVDKREVCGLGFDIEARIQNAGAVALSSVLVELTVTGGGQTHKDNVTIDLTRNESRAVSFQYTAPAAGTYEFRVQVKAAGDGNPDNDAMSRWATACDPDDIDTTTNVDPDFPWWLLVIIIVIVVIVIYNYYEYNRRKGTGPPRRGRTGG